MRLDQLLTQAGYGSRRQIKRLIKSHEVTIDGDLALSLGRNVDTAIQSIYVGRQKIEGFGEKYFLLNKPVGVVTASHDKVHKTVLDCLKLQDYVEGIYPVGRLDRDTEGLILLTTNGPLGYRMLHPSHHVIKKYEVIVNGPLYDDAPAFFEKGIVFLDGSVCKPAQLKILETSETFSRAYISISEGKFHQVKKMFLAYGVKVIRLKRYQFGPFILEKELVPGAYRELTEQEKRQLLPYLD